jgi:hypothetical protein
MQWRCKPGIFLLPPRFLKDISIVERKEIHKNYFFLNI